MEADHPFGHVLCRSGTPTPRPRRRADRFRHHPRADRLKVTPRRSTTMTDWTPEQPPQQPYIQQPGYGQQPPPPQGGGGSPLDALNNLKGPEPFDGPTTPDERQ